MNRSVLLITFFLFTVSALQAQYFLDTASFKTISKAELTRWKFAGKGYTSLVEGGFTLKEGGDSKGVMLISADTLPSEFIVRFDALPLSASTVFVFICSAEKDSAPDSQGASPYDGNIRYWLDSKNYFVAFRNFPHGYTPYIACNGADDSTEYGHSDVGNAAVLKVEIGIWHGEIWCRVNNRLLVQRKLHSVLPGGFWAFRIRGLENFPAGCLIRNIRYYHP
jgi:hypothetical protein